MPTLEELNLPDCTITINGGYISIKDGQIQKFHGNNIGIWNKTLKDDELEALSSGVPYSQFKENL